MKRTEMVKTLATLTAVHALKFVHIRPLDSNKQPVRFGGLTIAYLTTNERNNMISISLAWCNPSDAYDKLKGRFYSAFNFESGQCVAFRVADRKNVERSLISVFEPSINHMLNAPLNNGHRKSKQRTRPSNHKEEN